MKTPKFTETEWILLFDAIGEKVSEYDVIRFNSREYEATYNAYVRIYDKMYKIEFCRKLKKVVKQLKKEVNP